MSLFAAVDLNGLLQFIFTLFTLGGFLLYLVKITASNYFLLEESDNDSVPDWSSTASSRTSGSSSNSSATINNRNSVAAAGKMGGDELVVEACVVCGNITKKQCSGCKMVKYCSPVCQRSHWRSGHKAKCKDLELSVKSLRSGTKISGGSCSSTIRAKKILFPYEEFVGFFNWDKPGFPPCGLINCGNSCFANVVLQCLAYTKPLVAFLLEKGHRRDCRRNDWCFLCEFESHVERVSQSSQPFSPFNILSRLPNMGGNLGYGKQEDAHEFMRFAIDTMQSACLDKFGGEKALHPSSQETTLIQHIFGGHLQSKVICEKCKNVSNQIENMMDLTVEIHGDAASLEECLDQFTAKECLDGDNMYKCDGCNDYTMAWKRLTVRCAPNILTIALKRFQSGRFGKLNKRVTFPETLDLNRYMSEGGDNMNIYRLYAVIVHLDMLNASFFGHYICYIKDFRGKWYRIDDCKVIGVNLEDVLSQGAYMLLYSRIRARSSSLYPVEISKKIEQENVTGETEVALPSSVQPVSQEYTKESCTIVNSGLLQEISESKDINVEETTPSSSKSENEDVKMDIEVEGLLDIDIHEEGTDHMELIGDNNNLTGPCSSSLVEDENGVAKPSSFSFMGSYDVPVAIDTEEKLQVSCVSEEVNTSSGGPRSLIAPVQVSSVLEEVNTSSRGPQRVIAPVQVSSVSEEVNPPQRAIGPVHVSSISEEANSSSGSLQRVIAPVVQVSNVSEEVNTSSGAPQCVIAPFAGRTLNGGRSRASSTPFLSPGFLDKRRPPKKSTKQEDEVLELGQQQVPPSSNSKTTSKINGVIKPSFFGQTDVPILRSEKIENGDCSNHNNDLTL